MQTLRISHIFYIFVHIQTTDSIHPLDATSMGAVQKNAEEESAGYARYLTDPARAKRSATPGKGHQPARREFLQPDADPARGSGAIPDSVECSGGPPRTRVRFKARAAVRSAGAAYMLNYNTDDVVMFACVPNHD
jgi:hypothetical protein